VLKKLIYVKQAAFTGKKVSENNVASMMLRVEK